MGEIERVKMLFNSIDFVIFLPIVFMLYWFVFNKNISRQNLLITISSYVFYGWWDWRFLSLIAFSTVVDYFVGKRLLIINNTAKRKVLLFTSIIVNLGFLGIFKYYNFFLETFIQAFSFLGHSIESNSLNIISKGGYKWSDYGARYSNFLNSIKR